MIPGFSVSELLAFYGMLARSHVCQVKNSQRRFYVPFSRIWAIFFILGSLFGFCASALATTCSTVASGFWSSPSSWASGILPNDGDTVIINQNDSLWLDESSPALRSLRINGFLGLRNDSLFLHSANGFDTVVTINGTLDADTGWFVNLDSTKPIVRITATGRFRTAAALPYVSPSIFDSSIAPFFVCDSGSTFEYYSHNFDLIDITYLANNIVGGKYWNLTLTAMNAKMRWRPLVVQGTLRIGLGSSIIPETQQITIFGDVINENQGESGAPGAGLRGCGMQSSSFDQWIFDRPAGLVGKDTCHWIGPSQLGIVTVRTNTVLSVRYIDDKHCDSLDILTHLTEEEMPCGGHVIGKVFSEFTRTLDSTNPVDSFYGFGLTIRSGSDPYLGRVRITRTTGYLPPNINDPSTSRGGLGGGHSVLRYYTITPSAGPQLGLPNEMLMQVHCEEMNGAHGDQLHFWRSRDQGATWAFSGLINEDLAKNLFTWDTTVLGWPNDSGSFYWTLAEGYTDTPLPAGIQNFTAHLYSSDVLLSWQSTSEINTLGYEIDRRTQADSETIASFRTNSSLLAHSNTGASYSYDDRFVSDQQIKYDLYEITKDGIREWLATQTALPAPVAELSDLSYSNGRVNITVTNPLSVFLEVTDAIGRSYFSKNIDVRNTVSIPINLSSGFYFINCRWSTGSAVRKVALP